MARFNRVTISDGPPTRLGRIVLAGEVSDDVPMMPRELRTMDAWVISVVTGGRGSYRHGDGRTQPITPFTITVVQPGVPHWYGTEPRERWSEWFAVVEGPLLELLRTTGIVTASGPLPLRPESRATELGPMLRARPPSIAVAERQLWTLAGWLMDALRNDLSDGGVWSRAEALLTADLRERVDLEQIAGDLGLSYDTFRRRFVSEFGQPPRAFRNMRRLETAATLLRLTSLTTREIARRLGYTDEFHLSRRFRAHFGQPPRDYRKTHQH